MTQEVRVMLQLTLDCDITLTKQDIQDRVIAAIQFSGDEGIDVMMTDIIEVRDESEIYGTENLNIEKTFQVEKYDGVVSYAHLLKETEIITMYIDYVNNFLSVERFAEYYKLTLSSAEFIISKGRELLNH